MRFILIYFLLMLSGCGTLTGWKNAMYGEDPVKVSEYDNSRSRGPASVQSGVALPGDQGQDSIGSDLGRSEFARYSGIYNEAALRGVRRNANPWDGTGPVNEGSLWNPYGQDGFYFVRNTSKRVGDLIVVKVEPDINDALNSKIAALLGRTGYRQVIADEAGKAVGQKVANKVGKMVGNEKVGQAVGGEANSRSVAALDPGSRYIDLDEVPVRVMEIGKGNVYKVDGVRKVLIKGAAYSLRMTGEVRDDDLGPSSTISSSKVLQTKLELLK